jgi:predicted nucleic acid-binding protein
VKAAVRAQEDRRDSAPTGLPQVQGSASGAGALKLEWVTPDRFLQAEALFRKYRDQAFSFTDCTSFAVMQERRLREVITMDDHFRIMGFQLLPVTS